MRTFFSRQRARLRTYWFERSLGEQARLRILGVVLLVGVVVAPLLYFVGRPAWSSYRLRHALAQADAFEAAQDYPRLLLALQRASRIGSSDVITWKRIAETLSRLGHDDSIVAWGNVVALAPDDIEARIAYATEALRFGQFTPAQRALTVRHDDLDPDAAYERVAARLAMVLGDYDAVIRHLQTSVELDPAEKDVRLVLALVQVWSPHQAIRDTGRASLETMLTDPDLRVRAGIELLKLAARERDGRLAALLVDLLLAPPPPLDPPSPSPDKLENVINRFKNAAREPRDAAALAAWLGEIRRGPDALQWLRSLPAEIGDDPGPLEVAAELALGTDQLALAHDYLERQALGPLPSSAALLALSARQLQLLGQADAADVNWRAATETLTRGGSSATLRTLAKIAALWRQTDWARHTLEAALERSPDAPWAFAALREQELAAADADRLWQLYDRWVERHPDDPLVVNQWLRLGTLLPAARSRLEKYAPVVLDGLPDLPLSHAIRAGWLWHQNRPEEARETLRRSGEAPKVMPDAAYWAARINPVANPEQTYPLLQRLTLLPIERAALMEKRPAGSPPATAVPPPQSP